MGHRSQQSYPAVWSLMMLMMLLIPSVRLRDLTDNLDQLDHNHLDGETGLFKRMIRGIRKDNAEGNGVRNTDAVNAKFANDLEFVKKRLGQNVKGWEDILNIMKTVPIDLKDQLINAKKISNDNNVKDKFAKIRNCVKKDSRLIFQEHQQHSYVYAVSGDEQDFLTCKLVKLNILGTPEHTELQISNDFKEQNLSPGKKDVYWFTENTPCLTPSALGSTQKPTTNVPSCINVMLWHCSKWFGGKSNNSKGRCYIGFNKYWGFRGENYIDFIKKVDPNISEATVKRNIFWKVLSNPGLKFLDDYHFNNYASFVYLGDE